MDFSRFFAPWSAIGLVLIATVAIYLIVVLYTRLAGPRSMATMSSFDFAASVAIGSTVATVANLGTPLAHGLVTLAVLYLAQLVMAQLRRNLKLGRALDNQPILLMDGEEILKDHLRTARVTEPELWSQLRRAGVSRLDQVLAVVMETTGDISVIKAESSDASIEPKLLAGVRGASVKG